MRYLGSTTSNRALSLAFVLSAIALITSCHDQNPLEPTGLHRPLPKPSKTLSGYGGVASPRAMNSAGEVIGTISVGTQLHAAISLNGTAYDLGTIDKSDSTSSYAMGINNRGQVVGYETVGSGLTYGFLWTPDAPNGAAGTMQRLVDSPAGASQALAVNDAGEILGTPAYGSGIVLWVGTQVTDLPSADLGLLPDRINRYGQVAGTAVDGSGQVHPFLWTPALPNGTTGQFTVLATPGGYGWPRTGLNDYGEVLVADDNPDGTSLWIPASPNATSGSAILLRGATGTFAGVDINSRGDVLANADGPPQTPYCGATSHAFVWRPHVPNGAVGSVIDVTPDVGFEGPSGFGSFYCMPFATGAFMSEEENATIQAFGQLADLDGDTQDQQWAASGLDVPQPLTARFYFNLDAWRGYYEGTTFAFGGSTTTPYSSTLTFQWDFGDGTTATGLGATHTWGDNGNYTIRLTVTDTGGGSSTFAETFPILNLPPSGRFSVTSTQLNEGGSYTLSMANVTDVAADLPTLQLSFDCGDGRGYQPTPMGGSLTCAASNDGLRTARGRLRDKDGGVSEYTAQITVLNVAPTITAFNAPASVSEQTSYAINFSFADPGVLDHWGYNVDWGDGTVTGPIAVGTQDGTISSSHRYKVDKRGGAKSATYQVSLSVFDDGGGTNSITRSVVVSANGSR